MDEQLDTLFARFRREKDPELLAQVFDRTAPRLLRLAIHLAGDPSEAEDLVQATFLTAIERAPSFDGSRPLVPWLLGILANHARSTGRKERREPDFDRLIAREQATPLEEAQRAEISGALARAIDELPEPYRQTLTLRLRHGMKAADIAHVLGKSPGAVRVRIHRGLEMLRERLPAGFAAWLFVSPTRGLGAIRSAVVAEAGGALVGKKLLVAGIAAILLLAGIAGVKSWSAPANPAVDAEVVKLQAPSSSIDEPQPTAERIAIATTSASETTHFRIRVVEGGSDRPIAGARVRVFPPRKTHLLDLVRRWPELVECDLDGTLLKDEDVWPHLASAPSDFARAGREDVEVVDPPLAGVRPTADLVSGPDGACELGLPSSLGFVSCTAPDFEERLVPLVEEALTIRMWKPRRLAGHLIDTRGDRIHERVRLRFWGFRDQKSGSRSTPSDRAGHWLVETDADGAFDASLAADRVQASAVDPDWELTNVGTNPENGQRWAFQTSFAPGAEAQPAILVARRCPVLVVTDATSGQPIETFSVSSRDPANGYPKWSGRRFARGGRIRLTDVLHDELTVWAEHRVPQTFRVDERLRDDRAVVALERGELPVLEGVVRDDSGPLPALVVSVLTFGPLQWTEEEQSLIDSMPSDAEGRFRFSLPAGTWLLRCTDEDKKMTCQLVQVPSAGPVVVDFDHEACVIARIHDTDGAPRPAQTVILRGVDGRQSLRATDARGEIAFPGLTAGAYRLHVPRRVTRYNAQGGETIPFELRDGERRTIDATVPFRHEKFARIVADPPVAFTGWQASDATDQELYPVDPDGRVPIDLTFVGSHLEIQSLAGMRWQAAIPEDAPDGFPIRIDTGARGYEGVLRTRTGSGGSPVFQARVIARPLEGGISALCVTSIDGSFRLTGLADADYELSLESSREPNHAERSKILFTPFSRPRDPPVRLEIDLPGRGLESGENFAGLETHVVSGHVRVADVPVGGLTVRVGSEIPTGAGSLWLYPPSATSRVNDVGAYSVTIPFAPRHRVDVWGGATGHKDARLEWDGTAFQSEEAVRDIELPE